MRRIAGLAIALAAFGFAGQAAAQGVAARFEIGGVNFVMPVPAGYCLPTADQQPAVDALAASDRDNKTSLTLLSCGPNADEMDYLIIKTPVDVVSLTISRTTLLSSLGPEFDKPMGADFDLGATERDIEGRFSESAGRPVSVAAAVSPRGHDDVCGYIGGTVKSDALEGGVITVASCLTVVSGRVLAINLYARGDDPATLRALLKRTRALALTVTGKR
jgi:hypothetical protein